MRVRLTHIDGKLPNLALMKLAHWHRARGDEVVLTRNPRRDLFEGDYGAVYGSAMFTRSRPLVEALLAEFPGAVVGGTGAEAWRAGTYPTVEQHLGVAEYEHHDYSAYPGFAASIGFTARGCRLRCGFCIVPVKEGRPRSVNTVADIWRGGGHPRHLHLLDNDFFGQPEAQWRARLAEVRDGGFRVCFNQGINVRMVTDEVAAELARTPYYDDAFKVRRLYTAWDNLKDRAVFERGVGRLAAAGVKPAHVMAYMLVGYDPAETMARVLERFEAIVALGVLPYPMVYNRGTDPERERDLRRFARWAIRRYYQFMPFSEYRATGWRDATLHERAKAFDFAGADA